MEWCSIKVNFFLPAELKKRASDLIFSLLEATHPHLHGLIWKETKKEKERKEREEEEGEGGGGGGGRKGEGGGGGVKKTKKKKISKVHFILPP